jgi:hypothetical protein
MFNYSPQHLEAGAEACMLVFRLLVWLSLIMAVIPANPADFAAGKTKMADQHDISALRLVVADLVNVCERKPDFCGKVRSLLWRWGMKGFNALPRDFYHSEPESVDFMHTAPLY